MRSALAYFSLVFGFGFLFGVFRVFLLEKVMAEEQAVFFELPFMLSWSWIVAKWIFAEQNARTRLVGGCIAFFLLMASEYALAIAFGMPFLKTNAQWIGFAGQVVFAIIPVIVD